MNTLYVILGLAASVVVFVAFREAWSWHKHNKAVAKAQADFEAELESQQRQNVANIRKSQQEKRERQHARAVSAQREPERRTPSGTSMHMKETSTRRKEDVYTPEEMEAVRVYHNVTDSLRSPTYDDDSRNRACAATSFASALDTPSDSPSDCGSSSSSDSSSPSSSGD